MKKAVFVDGQHGTTGLQIRERLNSIKDVEVIEISEDKRKDIETKRKLLNEVDIVFLCLPDDAARESVSLIKNNSVHVIDGSTAHRVAEGWVYGLPELRKEQRALIKGSRRVTVPGCHAAGFVMMLYPLIVQGIVSPDYPVTCHAIAGYSGGGKAMINEYENDGAPDYVRKPHPFSLPPWSTCTTAKSSLSHWWRNAWKNGCPPPGFTKRCRHTMPVNISLK
jgi:N-acetyl-gamma-glutamyl-phosphate reductase